MSEDEIRMALDRNRKLPIERAAREGRAAYRGAPLWHAEPAADFPFEDERSSEAHTGHRRKPTRRAGLHRTDWTGAGRRPEDRHDRQLTGIFPQGFLPWALRLLGAPRSCLHVCSGSLRPIEGHVRVDIRSSMAPDVVADGRHLPFLADAFDAALIDPPYTVEYSETLYGTEYPRPSHLLAEAARCVRPGGRIGILHFLVPRSPARTSHLGVWGVTTGTGYRIRAFTLFQREEARLPL